MKKICFVIDKLSAGAGRVVYDLAKFLDKTQFEVVIASLYPNGDLLHLFKKLNVKIINLNKKSGKDLGLILRLRKLIIKEKIDIVHTHNVDAYEYGVLAAWLAGVNKIIHTTHGKSVKETKLKRIRENIFHKFISLFLTDYIAVSKDLGRYAAKNWCLNKKKIRLVYNGIDINKYKKINFDKKFLYKLGIIKNDLLIGIIAGLRPVKDHPTLLKSMEMLIKKVPNSKLLITGDGPEKEKLLGLVKKLRLENNVLFLGNRTDIVRLLNCLDVGVLCSLSECLSISLLEGMACEVPFIVTNVGGNPEVIENNKDGYLVPPRNSKILAEKLINLLQDKKLMEKIGKKAREKVVKKFNVKNMIKSYERLYLE
ncbi:MAG: glycosyltransferase [Candidatus Omnitrophica bacterium]|nr:glycosyltransferase [Candidatus Omnitrophota bacterium]